MQAERKGSVLAGSVGHIRQAMRQARVSFVTCSALLTLPSSGQGKYWRRDKQISAALGPAITRGRRSRQLFESPTFVVVRVQVVITVGQVSRQVHGKSAACRYCWIIVLSKDFFEQSRQSFGNCFPEQDSTAFIVVLMFCFLSISVLYLEIHYSIHNL